MKLQPQLYIDTSGNPLGEPSFERVEFYDFESIEITSTVQDVRDIAKVFTDFTQSFSVPASKVNNRIFRHYYDTTVEDGFDARIQQKAELYLNGIRFRSGYVRLSKSTLSNGKPVSYRLTFFGGLTSISNVIGNAMLSDLSSLDKYNHAYNIDNVYNGFAQGLQYYVTPELITNGGFDTDSNWVKGTGWSISGGTANQDGSNGILRQGNVVSTNTKAKVTFELSNYGGSGGLQVKVAPNTYTITLTGDGIYSISTDGTNSVNGDLQIISNNGFTGSIDNVSVIEDVESMIAGDNRDIIYPSITASNKWYYDSSAATAPVEFNQGTSVNLYDDSGAASYGLDWRQLKPAIKLKHIIDAIEEKYSSIVFSDDFFGTADFDDVYMLLSNNKGVLAPSVSEIEDRTVTYRIGTASDSDFTLDPTFSEQRPMETYWEYVFPNKVRIIQYHVIIDITNTTISGGGGGTPNYTLEVLDGTTVIDRVDLSGDQQYTSVLCTPELKSWDNVNIRITSPSDQLNDFEIDLELKMVRYKMSANNTSEYLCDVDNFADIPETESSLYSTADTGTQTLVQNIEITRNMPKLKITEFLTGLFKTYNLTARVNDEGVIVVKTLNQYYDDGNTIDITPMIDSDDVTVSRMELYRNIEFKYKDPKTLAIKKNNEILNTDFGNLDYQATSDGTNSSLIFDGKNYSVKLPFEKIYYERLYDEDDLSVKTSISQGWLVDDAQNDTLTSPVIFINIPQDVDSSHTLFGFKDKGLITKYNRAANTNASETFNGVGWDEVFGTKSLNFNKEFDEFTRSEVSRGLFRNYYNDYIATVFDKNTRIIEVDMNASLSFLLNYEVNDTLLIKGEEYLINNIRTDLTTGKTKLELILKFFREVPEDITGEPLTVPTGLNLVYRSDTSWIVGWNANPANQLLKGYKVYVDGVLDATLLLTTSYTKTGLPSGTSYDVQIRAYDSQGNQSALSSALTVTTRDSDTTPPSIPQNLVNDSKTDVSVGISWDASTDNVGVDSYDVYVDGVFNQNVSSTSATIFGLTSNTVYGFTVKAKDVAGNTSGFSNEIQVRTL